MKESEAKARFDGHFPQVLLGGTVDAQWVCRDCGETLNIERDVWWDFVRDWVSSMDEEINGS